MRKRKKGEAKFSPRSYRFSSRTQSLISKLSQMTGKEQNDTVRKALEMYKEILESDKKGAGVSEADVGEQIDALAGILERQKVQEVVNKQVNPYN